MALTVRNVDAARNSKPRPAHHCTALPFGEFNRLMGTLKPQSNGPLYSNTVIGTLVIDWLAITFGTARRGQCSALLAVPNVSK